MLAAACSGGDDDPAPTATSTTVPATSTAVASPTSEPLAPGEADGARAYEHVRRLTEIGSRVAGSPQEIIARDYIKAEFESYGYVTTIQEFPFDGTRYRTATMRVGADEFPGIAFRGSPSGTAGGTLVAAGIGRPEDFPPGGLQGAVALIERGTLTFVEKAANAAAAGASAAIIYNNVEGLLIGDAEDVVIPLIGVARVDGEAMLTLASGVGGAQVAVDIAAPRGTAYNVVAKPAGVTACRTVSGGHFDSIPATTGADDNASGTGGVLELARVVAANGLAGAHCFVAFGAEEFGLYGSLAFVESMTDAEIVGVRAMLNLDVIGTSSRLTLIGDDDVAELARVEAQEAGIDVVSGGVPKGSSSDHASFEEAGIPVIFFYRPDDLIHTKEDAIGRILPQSLEDTIAVAYGVLESLGGGT